MMTLMTGSSAMMVVTEMLQCQVIDANMALISQSLRHHEMFQHHKGIVVERKVRVSELSTVFAGVLEHLVGAPPLCRGRITFAFINRMLVSDVGQPYDGHIGGGQHGHPHARRSSPVRTGFRFSTVDRRIHSAENQLHRSKAVTYILSVIASILSRARPRESHSCETS